LRSQGWDDEEVMDLKAESDVAGHLVLARAAIMFAWLLGFFGMTLVAGLLISMPVFVFAYLLWQGREKLPLVATYTAAMLVFQVGVVHYFLTVPWLKLPVPGPQQALLLWLDALVR